MKKPNTQGFSHIEVLIVTVVILVVGAVGFYVFNKVQNRSSKAETANTELDKKRPSDLRAAGSSAESAAASAPNEQPHARWRMRHEETINGRSEFNTFYYFNDSDTSFFISDPNGVNQNAGNSIQGEGIGFYAYSPFSSQGQRIASLRKTTCNVNRTDSRHGCVNAIIYTFSEEVKQKALRNGYSTVNYVTIADFNVFPTQVAGSVPVYRLGKSVTNQNHSYFVYTDSDYEKGEYIRKGFKDEGVAFYAPPKPNLY